MKTIHTFITTSHHQLVQDGTKVYVICNLKDAINELKASVDLVEVILEQANGDAYISSES